ncbi:MAG: hypothetical protein WBA31_01470 [Candidatus Dormiibacterota bacterium]
MSKFCFLEPPVPSDAAQDLFDDDVSEHGFVMNASKLWAYQPATMSGLFDLMREAVSPLKPTTRQRGILVTAGASTVGDSYCSLAWGSRLANASDPEVASGVLRGDDQLLSPEERAMAGWARKIARNPNGTSAADVQQLRDAGFSDAQIFAITAFVALRLAFSTINDALGARPDAAYRSSVPAPVLEAVSYGRPIEDGKST